MTTIFKPVLPKKRDLASRRRRVTSDADHPSVDRLASVFSARFRRASSRICTPRAPRRRAELGRVANEPRARARANRSKPPPLLRRVYFSDMTVMTGGFSSSLISGYSTFLRLRSLMRSCEEERGSGGGRVGRGQPPSETARRRGTRAEVRGRGRRGGRGAGARGARSRASMPRASRFRVQGFGGSILRRTMRGAHLLGPRLRVVLGRLGVDVRGGADGEGGGSADDEGHVSWERADARGAFLSGSGASAPRARTGKSEARDVVVAPSGPEQSTISTVCDPRRSVDHRRSTAGDGSSRPIESTDFAASRLRSTYS